MHTEKHRLDALAAIRMMENAQDVVKDTHGNVSSSDGVHMCIKPSGVPFELIGYSDLCEINIETEEQVPNTSLGGGMKPSVDTRLHRQIYWCNSWVGGICHTHSPYATAFAIRGMSIKCYTTEQADYFGAEIECLPYVSFDYLDDYVAVHILPTTKAFLLESHGVLTFGKTATEAVKLAIALENIAFKNWLAYTLPGSPLELMNPNDAKKWHERYQHGYGQNHSNSE